MATQSNPNHTRKFDNSNTDMKAFGSSYFIERMKAIEEAGRLDEVVTEIGEPNTARKYSYQNLKFTDPLTGKNLPTVVECKSVQISGIKTLEEREEKEIPLGLNLSSKEGDAYQVLDYLRKVVNLFNPDIKIKFINEKDVIDDKTKEEKHLKFYYVNIRDSKGEFPKGTEITRYTKKDGKVSTIPATVMNEETGKEEDVSPENIDKFITYNSRLTIKIIFSQYRKAKDASPEMVLYTRNIAVIPGRKKTYEMDADKQSFMDEALANDAEENETAEKLDDLQF